MGKLMTARQQVGIQTKERKKGRNGGREEERKDFKQEKPIVKQDEKYRK